MRRTNRIPLAILLLKVLTLVSTAIVALPGHAQNILHLDPMDPEARGLSFRATGHDPEAPRELVLWRFSRGVLLRVDATRSITGGHFDFGQVSIALSEGTFHVAPRGTSPDLSRPLRINPLIPGPAILTAGPTRSTITVVPALYEGELRDRDATTDRLWIRFPIDSTQGNRLRVDLAEAGLPEDAETVTIEQILADGRRSKLSYWKLTSD